MSDSGTVSEPRFTAFVAIDWADRRHVYALEDAATGRRQTGMIEHTPEAVEAWVAELLQHRGGPVAVARGSSCRTCNHCADAAISARRIERNAGRSKAMWFISKDLGGGLLYLQFLHL